MTAIALIPARGGSKRVHTRPRADKGRLRKRFWELFEVSNPAECWPWVGRVNSYGYGIYNSRPAHRVVYEQLRGPIPTDTLDHLCRNRICVNPGHLEPVTRGENVRRGIGVGAAQGERNRKKTHCPQGHEYNEANTFVYGPRNYRACRPCGKEKMRRRRACQQ